MVINIPNKEFLNCRRANIFIDNDALLSLLPFLQLGMGPPVSCSSPKYTVT